MKHSLFLSFIVLSAILATPAQAIEPKKGEIPASLCVTIETQKAHNNTLAQYEKDIAPYKDNESAQDAIKAYKDKIDIAWSAMEQPYCGYGGGNPLKSSIKSYNKAVTRARSNFSEAVKSLDKKKIIAPTPAPSENKAVESTPVEKKSSSDTSSDLRTGLSRGQRSDAVLELQKRLADYFDLPDPSSIQTGYFGPKTEELLIKFQLEQKIITSETDPGAGLVGPKTLKALLSV